VRGLAARRPEHVPEDDDEALLAHPELGLVAERDVGRRRVGRRDAVRAEERVVHGRLLRRLRLHGDLISPERHARVRRGGGLLEGREVQHRPGLQVVGQLAHARVRCVDEVDAATIAVGALRDGAAAVAEPGRVVAVGLLSPRSGGSERRRADRDAQRPT
jgi:hypothetical protein